MTDHDHDQNTRAALVTGGAKRIGRAVSLALVRAGYAVAIHVRRPSEPATAFAREIEAAGGRAALVYADLHDAAEVAGLIDAARAAMGPLTLLVNNACEFERDEFGSLDRKQWDRHFAINLAAPIFLAEAFAAQADGVDPAIVNLLDQRVLKPTPRFLSYALTKSALHTATTMLAQALAPRIRVNAVAPGPTLPSTRQSQDDFGRQVATLPLQRRSNPEDIADAVVFLAQARAITGQTIAVDGGQHIAWQTPDTACNE